MNISNSNPRPSLTVQKGVGTQRTSVTFFIEFQRKHCRSETALMLTSLTLLDCITAKLQKSVEVSTKIQMLA